LAPWQVFVKLSYFFRQITSKTGNFRQMWFCSDWYLYFLFRYSDQGISGVEEMSSHQISTKRMKLEKSSSFVNPFEYVHLDIFYIMFICNIVNIVQHSHLYNSFLLIIVACIHLSEITSFCSNLPKKLR
jgi:hypothetical protein